LLQKLGEGISKQQFVNEYMKMFRKLLLVGDVKSLSAREESLLDYEKQSCELLYESFCKKHARAPDSFILKEQVKKSFIKRAKLFARVNIVIDEEQFVISHIEQLKKLREMKAELYVIDGYQEIIRREKKCAQDYFRVHDDYPEGYEELIISRSYEMVNIGLEKLMLDFKECYKTYYFKYRKDR
jgi:hypothetical protein